MQGAVAFVAAALLFKVSSYLVASYYPQDEERPEVPEVAAPMRGLQELASSHPWVIAAAAIATALLLIPIAVRLLKHRDGHMWPPLLVGSALLAMSLLHYHVAAVLILVGAVFWLRSPDIPKRWLYTGMALAALLAVSHLVILHASGLYPGRKLFGAVTGQPSVWPVLRFLNYSPAAGAIYLLTSSVALARFCRGVPLPDHFLVFILAVWAPLFLMGFFDWYIPPRYASGHIAPFLVCVFAGLGYVWTKATNWTATTSTTPPAWARPWPTAIGLALVSAAIVNPVVFARTVYPSYSIYPDHKGAANYIKGLHLPGDAVLIAEDVLQQTYYLGSVNYYLREFDRSYNYAVIRNGRAVDQYTGVPVIGTGRELGEILDHSRGREVFVIGSGENFKGNRRLFRGRGIQEVLDSQRLQVVYNGRDGKTKIWKLVD